MQREYRHLFPPLQALIITQTNHPPGDFFFCQKRQIQRLLLVFLETFVVFGDSKARITLLSEHLSAMRKQFATYFKEDYRSFAWVRDPFVCTANELSIDMQEQLIELKSDSRLKELAPALFRHSGQH